MFHLCALLGYEVFLQMTFKDYFFWIQFAGVCMKIGEYFHFNNNLDYKKYKNLINLIPTFKSGVIYYTIISLIKSYL